MQSLQLDEMPSIDDTMETLEKWDSLNHLHLMMDLERELNLKFNSEKIPDMVSVKAILKEIENE